MSRGETVNKVPSLASTILANNILTMGISVGMSVFAARNVNHEDLPVDEILLVLNSLVDINQDIKARVFRRRH